MGVKIGGDVAKSGNTTHLLVTINLRLGTKGRNSRRGDNSIHFLEITYITT